MALTDEVTIYAPYDSSVSSVVLEESLPAWEAVGWTRNPPVAEAAPAPAPTPAPAPAQPAPTAQPAPSSTSSTSGTSSTSTS